MSRNAFAIRTHKAAVVLGLAAILVAKRGAAQVSVLSSTVEEHIGAAGESYLGRIEIANPDRAPQIVRLYQTDYHFDADGKSSFDQPASFARSNAAWISLQSTQVTIPAGGTLSVPYTVAIPKIDSLRGSYWSTVMVEPVEHATGSSDVSGKPQVGIGTIVRYAVQIATHIGTSGSRTVRFDAIQAKRSTDSASAGKALVDLNATNVGERAYRSSLWIEVYDDKGALRARAKQSRGLLYPGCSLRQHFELGMLPPGTYKAVIFADTGEETVYASQYSIVF